MLELKKLRIEYRENPIGLDVKKPGFSWIMVSDEKNVTQEFYRIYVKNHKEAVWDTGKVKSDQSIHVIYEGNELLPQVEYKVTVTVWDNYGSMAEITGRFETGLIDYKNFAASWITHTLHETNACPVFTKNFSLKRNVKKARIYATALGIYDIHINNNRVGEYYFSPGWTNYRKRIQYQTYDVTNILNKNNIIDMTVANGWYKGIFGFSYEPDNYGNRSAVLMELHVWYEDGSKEIILTDESWKCTTGTVRCSEIYNGETIDNTFNSQKLKEVSLFEGDYTKLVAQESEPVRIVKKIKPVASIITPKGEKVLDFGQNMTGIVELKIMSEPGQKIIIYHAEVLDEEGNFYTRNLRRAKATDTFICKGGEQVFLPRFTFHGFRYIAVEGIKEELNPDDFTACVLHTDMEQTGLFSCSHPDVNRLQSNIEWGQRSNFLDIPSDCPQRDERLGWTGDAQVFFKTASFNFNTALFFKKWLMDLASEQTPEYGVPNVVPNITNHRGFSSFWGDCATIIPWDMYNIYGDIRILQDQYDSMKYWVEFIRRKETDNHLWQSGFHFGDWLALDGEEGSNRTGSTDIYLIATACYAYSVHLLYQTAKILGYEDEYIEYYELYHKIRKGFNEEYITKTGRMVSETQTGCILALHFNLAYEEYRPRIIKSLVSNIEKHNNHLTTGFVGTPYICHTLTDNNHHDLSGKLLLMDDFPSWLYTVKKGATTMWERWNSIKPDGSLGDPGMNSFNHYAYGSIGDWMYQKLAGIQMKEPGYKHSILAPKIIEGLTYAKASLETMYGPLSCSWEYNNQVTTLDVTVPANTKATLYLPGKNTGIELGSGTYKYSY